MSELKSLASKLKAIDCTEGTANDYYSRRSEDVITKTAEISILDRDTMVKNMELEIEKIQDELDTHNALTQI